MPSKEYCDYILPFSNKILKASKDMNCPTIFFPKNLNNGLKNLEKKYCDYVSIDWQIDLEYARELLVDIGIQEIWIQMPILMKKKKLSIFIIDLDQKSY